MTRTRKYERPYIENARLGYQLAPDFNRAECTLDVFVRATASQNVQLSSDLFQGRGRVAHQE